MGPNFCLYFCLADFFNFLSCLLKMVLQKAETIVASFIFLLNYFLFVSFLSQNYGKYLFAWILQISSLLKLCLYLIHFSLFYSGIKPVDLGEYKLMVQPQVNGVLENVTKVILIEEKRDEMYKNVTAISLVCIGVVVCLLLIAVILWNYRQRIQVLHRRSFGAFDIGTSFIPFCL